MNIELISFLTSVVIGLLLAGTLFFYYFSNRALKERQNIIRRNSIGPVPMQVATELLELDIPPDKLDEATKRITKIVDEKVVQEADKLRNEYSKVLGSKDEILKDVQQKFETVQTNLQKIGKLKKQTESVIQSMAKGLIIMNEEGRVVFVNPAAEKIMGVKPQSLIGKSLQELEGDHVISLVNEDGQEQSGPMSRQREEAKEIIKESTAIIQGVSGQTKGVVSILTGVRQEMKVDEIKSEFLANVTHELRTPLVCIQKSLEAIAAGMKDASPEQKDFLAMALRNTERLEQMINDILDVSKMEAGKMPLRYEMIMMEAFMTEIRTMFEGWARDKKITIDIKADPEIASFEADPEKIRQVLVNLVANALKFTQKGGKIAIEAKTVKEKLPLGPEPLECIEIGVRDNGCGLSDADKKKIFQKFSNASPTPTDGERSTGLGLPIAKEIVELHLGRIWVQSEAGKGSYFAFLIPRRWHKSSTTVSTPPVPAAASTIRIA